MLGNFRRHGRALETVELDPGARHLRRGRLARSAGPTSEEKRFVERVLGIEVPTREEMREIEASSRVYEEGDALYLTATVLVNADEPPPDARPRSPSSSSAAS